LTFTDLQRKFQRQQGSSSHQDSASIDLAHKLTNRRSVFARVGSKVDDSPEVFTRVGSKVDDSPEYVPSNPQGDEYPEPVQISDDAEEDVPMPSSSRSFVEAP